MVMEILDKVLHRFTWVNPADIVPFLPLILGFGIYWFVKIIKMDNEKEKTVLVTREKPTEDDDRTTILILLRNVGILLAIVLVVIIILKLFGVKLD